MLFTNMKNLLKKSQKCLRIAKNHAQKEKKVVTRLISNVSKPIKIVVVVVVFVVVIFVQKR